MKKIKRILSLIMSIAMVLSLFAGIDIASLAKDGTTGNYIDIISTNDDWIDIGDEITCNVVTLQSWEEINSFEADIYFTDDDNFEIIDVSATDESYFSSLEIIKSEYGSWNISGTVENVPAADITLFTVTVKAIKPTQTTSGTFCYVLHMNASYNNGSENDYSCVYMEPINCPHENLKEHEEVPATCENGGHTAGQICIDCNTWCSGEDISSLGHSDLNEDLLCDNCSGKIATMKLSVDNSEPNIGDTFTVTVTLENISGLTNGIIEFGYNTNEFEIVEYSFNENLTYSKDDWYSFTFSFDEPVQNDSVEIVTVTYKALKGGSNDELFYISAENFAFTDDIVFFEIDVPCPHSITTECSEEAPTCENVGYTSGIQCNDCDEWISGHDWINPLGHCDSDEDLLCDNCSGKIATMKLSVDNSEPNIGDTFTVTVTLENISGLTDGGIDLAYYYNEYFEIVEYSFNEELTYSEYEWDNYNFSFSFDEPVQNDSIEIVTVTYKVIKGGPLNQGVYCWLSDFILIDNWNYVNINIECPHANTTECSEEAPTCNYEGYTSGIQCNDCDEWISGHDWINPLGHCDSDEDLLCDNCSGKIATMKLSVDNSEPNIGDTFTVTVTLEDISGLEHGYIGLPSPYNEDSEFEVVEYSFNEELTYSEMDWACFDFSFNKPVQNDSVEIVTVTYKALKGGSHNLWFDLGAENFAFIDNRDYIEIDVSCPHSDITSYEDEAATCATNGYTAGEYCNDCDTWLSGHEYLEKLPHTDSDNNNTCDVCEYTIAVYADATTTVKIIDGYAEVSFTPEKSGFYSIESVNAVNYSSFWFWDTGFNNTIQADSYTSGTSDFQTKYCFNAGSTYTFTLNGVSDYDVKITLLNETLNCHIDDNYDKYCDLCGVRGNSIYEFKYEVTDNNEAIITGYDYWFYGMGIGLLGDWNDFHPVNMSVPSFVYHYAEDDNEYTIPVVGIADGAFVGINTMQSVEIPSSVTSIGKYAFGYTEASDDAKIDGFVIKGISDSAAETYANENGFTFESLYTYEINNGEATITGCSDNIGNDIDIPAYINGYPVTAIGDYAFANKDLDDWTIPDTVVTIGEGAFENNHFNDQYSMFIPASVETIGDRAFANCDDLCSVYFGGNAIKSIGNGAFEDSALMYIDFKGTPAAWDNITIGENNELIESALKTFLGNSLDGYYYEIKNNEVIIYSCYLSDSDSEIVIPDTIEGCPVTTINAYAIDSDIEFTITKITIPASVVNIEDYAIGYYYDWELKDNVASKDLTIVGVPGSAAETYANENGFKFEAIEDGNTACQHVNTTATPSLDATCTADGYTQSEKCDNCGAVLTESVVIPATGHKDSNKDGYCDACNEKLSNDEPSDVELFKPDADFTESNNKQILTDVAAGTTYGQLLENSNADRLDIMSYDTVTTITSENSDDLLKTGDVLIFFDADGNEIGRYISELEGESYVDYDSDGYVTSDDAIYYLKCQMVPGYYPITGTIDFDSDGYRTTDDAIYLLKYTMVPELYDIY